MTNPQSPIIDFYPLDFRTDLNGKRAEWEALVLIPFIDQVISLSCNKACLTLSFMKKRLLDAMGPLENKLTADEKQRNSQNLAYEMTYDGTIKAAYPSPIPTLPAIASCPVAAVAAPWPHCKAGREHKAICAGVDFNVYRQGFPTFYHLPHKHQLEVAGVTVFERPSERPSLIVAVNSLFVILGHKYGL